VNRSIRTQEDVLRLLDAMFAPEADRWTSRGSDWWDRFYADRSRPVPFFAAKPDENLAAHLESGRLRPARALDLGCGPGRNALFLAGAGFSVDAVDLSPAAIDWARERAREAGAEISFHCGDAFGLDLRGPYDLVYDSGCLHHLAPHRRVSYLDLLDRILAPGGHLGLTCFASGETGSEKPDAELYGVGQLEGGLAFTPEDVRWIFSGFTELELRPMRVQPESSPLFGVEFLLTALFQRPAGAGAAARPAGAERGDERPVLPVRSSDEADVGWGDRWGSNDQRLLEDRPPHWGTD
jgi:SAM-dependent methyltransferase